MSKIMRVWSVVCVFVLMAIPVWAANDAADSAANYDAGALTNNANGGFGFEPWQISLGDGAVAELADSTDGAGDINSPNDLSFMFYGGEEGTYADATRPFNAALSPGDTFSFVMSYNWAGGVRGLVLLDATDELMYLQFREGDQLAYGFPGGADIVLDDTYFDGAVLEVTITQLAGNAIEVDLFRTNDGWNTNLTTGALAGPSTQVKFYNGGHAGDDINFALYVNDLEIVASGDLLLTLTGTDGMVVGMTNMLTVTRNGDVDDPLTVDLNSDDLIGEGVVNIPASVIIGAGQASAEFEVEGANGGVAEITASADDFLGATMEVLVFDIAYDDSSYYGGGWTDGSNGGAGFEPWVLEDNNDEGTNRFAGHFLGNSAAGGANVNASSGDAFGMYANGAAEPHSYAIRGFDDLEIGQTVAVTLGVNFLNGNKGVDFWHDDGNDLTRLFEFAATSDDYRYQNHSQGYAPVSLGWDHASDSVIEVWVSRLTNDTYSVWFTREGSAEEDNLINYVILDSAPNTMRFFIEGTESGDENDLYFNRLAVFTGTIGSLDDALVISGPLSLYVGSTGVYTVVRYGDVADTVDIGNTDAGVLLAPGSINFPSGEDETTFEAVALKEGQSTLTVFDFPDTESNPLVVTVSEPPGPSPYSDDASNYDDVTSPWVNGSNEGEHFDPWILVEGDGGFFLESSTEDGERTTDIDTAGRAFGMWNTNDANATVAIRPIEEGVWGDEAVLTFEYSFRFDDGTRGVTLHDAALDEFAYFTISGAGYDFNGATNAPTDWEGQRENGEVLTFTFTQDGADLNWEVSGIHPSSPNEEGTIVGEVLGAIRFFSAAGSGGGGNNIFFNKLDVTPGTPLATLQISGPNTVIEGGSYTYTLTRTGNVADLVDLESTNTDAMTVPLDVTFDSEENTVTFQAEAVAEGLTTLMASNADAASAPFAVTVLPPSPYSDDASNYDDVTSPWVNGSNEGAHFDPWILVEGDGGFFLGSSMEGGERTTDIDTAGRAFGMWNTNDANATVAIRPIEEGVWGDEAVLTFEYSFRFDDGTRGVTLHDAALDEFAYFTISGAGYDFNGATNAPTDWEGQRENGEVLTFTFTQDGADLNWEVSGIHPSSPDENGTIVGEALGAIRFFSAAGAGEGGNDIFFNKLDITPGTPEPEGPEIPDIYVNMEGEIEFHIPGGFNLIRVEGAELVFVGDGFNWDILEEDEDYEVENGVVTILTDDDGLVIRVVLEELGD